MREVYCYKHDKDRKIEEYEGKGYTLIEAIEFPRAGQSSNSMPKHYVLRFEKIKSMLGEV